MSTSKHKLLAPGQGKTTVMLRRAIADARNGQKVLVVAKDAADAKRLVRHAKDEALRLGCEWVVNGANVRILPAESKLLVHTAPGVIEFLGMARDKVYVDHAYLEEKYGGVLEAWLEGIPHATP